MQQVDKVDNKGVQLGFAALQVKERQVSRRMERGRRRRRRLSS